MTTVAQWQPGKLYLTGALCVPITQPAQTYEGLVNGGFETGDDTGWTFPAGASVVTSSPAPYQGTYCLKFTGTAGSIRAISDKYAVTPGTVINASAMYRQGAAEAGDNVGRVILVWYDSADAEISESTGTLISSSGSGGYRRSSITATAPATAASVAIGARVVRNDSAASAFDTFVWDLPSNQTPQGLMYRAVQADPGTSGNSEPIWPGVLGQTVLDNEVTWEAIRATRIVWQAFPLLESGGTEPTWPTTPGESVSDGTITWTCIARNITDENCPNTASVVIMASKVFAVDEDIVRFCATANPLDWTSENDAGYLPTGLQQANANDMVVLNQYRSNLVAMNASSFQMWQVDPDPANMAILDQMDGVGSVWQHAAQPVGNELLYLSQLGVRSVGIANAAQNLQAGDVGMPIDPLVREALLAAQGNDSNVLATYYPGAGQYWLAFSNYPPPSLSIAGPAPDGYVTQAYSHTYTLAGGVLPYTVTTSAGTVMSGSTLSTAGVLAGTLTTEQTATFTAKVTDAVGDTATLPEVVNVLAQTAAMGVLAKAKFWADTAESSGSVANEEVTGADGAYTSVVSYDLFSRNSQGKEFGTGSGAAAQFPTVAATQIDNDFTVCSWFYATNTSTNQWLFGTKDGAGDSSYHAQKGAGGSTGKMVITINANARSLISTNSYPLSAWAFLVYDKAAGATGEERLLMNNVVEDTEPAQTLGYEAGSYLNFGGDPGGTRGFGKSGTGAAAQLMFFSPKLTDEELTYLYNSGAGKTWAQLQADQP